MKLIRLLLYLTLVIVLFGRGNMSRPDTYAATPAEAPSGPILLVTNSAARHVSFVDPAKGVISRIEVGAAPWGIALAPDNRAYISTAEGVAVVDTQERKFLALIPYRARIGPPEFGEYRPGGMGIAASADGKRVYVGVYLSGQPSQLEIIDTKKSAVIASVKVGVRPFDVLTSRGGDHVYSIDHDSYSLTVVDPRSLSTRMIKLAPLGNGAFDKPHYAAMGNDGRLWLPYQGKTLVNLDPDSGNVITSRLTADTHQHGAAFTPDGRYLLIVGTGAAGGATQGPSLTIFDTQDSSEEVLPLSRPHENVAISPDRRWAYLTGGYLLSGGWDGLTIYDLQKRAFTELSIPDRPQDVAILP